MLKKRRSVTNLQTKKANYEGCGYWVLNHVGILFTRLEFKILFQLSDAQLNQFLERYSSI